MENTQTQTMKMNWYCIIFPKTIKNWMNWCLFIYLFLMRRAGIYSAGTGGMQVEI